MAEHCKERYAVHHFSSDVLWRAAGLLRAFGGVDEKETGVSLGDVMDMLDYKGERFGLQPTSVVDELMFVGDAVHFTVRDNFSPFNICDSLAEKLRQRFDVDVIYQVDEGAGFGLTSDIQHFEAISREMELNLVKRHVKQVMDRTKNVIALTEPFRFGYGDNYINWLNYDGLNLVSSDGRNMFVSYDSLDKAMLDNVKSALVRHDELKFGKNYVSLCTDIEGKREELLAKVYGSSVAYQNISAFMRGVDLVYTPEGKGELSAEMAKHIAFNTVSLDPVESFGRFNDLLEHGSDAVVALKKIGIKAEDIVIPESLEIRFDGKPLCVFAKTRNYELDNLDLVDQWDLKSFDKDNMEAFNDFCGIDLMEELVNIDDSDYSYATFDGKYLAELSGRCMLSPENLQMVSSAEQVCKRKATQKDFYNLFIKPSNDIKPDGPKLK